MLQREQNRDETRTRHRGDAAGAGGGQDCQEANAYYSSVDNAINKALSVDSAMFNAQVEQQNGQ